MLSQGSLCVGHRAHTLGGFSLIRQRQDELGSMAVWTFEAMPLYSHPGVGSRGVRKQGRFMTLLTPKMLLSIKFPVLTREPNDDLAMIDAMIDRRAALAQSRQPKRVQFQLSLIQGGEYLDDTALDVPVDLRLRKFE